MKTHRRRSPAARAAMAGIVIALAAGACASAGKRYEQGMELEERGQVAGAAERYIDALKKDPSLADARARLQEAGDRAVAGFVAAAESHDAAGRHEQAAESYLQADALRREALSVRVTLAVPADYAARRRATLDRAIDASLREGEAALERREYQGIIRTLERAQSRWQPSPEQRARLDEARFGAYVDWATFEADQGRFRGAFQRAEQAANVFDGRPEMAERARALQEDVLRRGTVRVAILPPEADPPRERRLPAGLLAAVEDDLETEHWTRPPRFVDVIDPREVRREIRRRGTPADGVLGVREASIVGRALDAELAVLLAVDSVANTEQVSRTERRAARTAQGADTAYTVRDGRRRTWTRVSYLVIDVETRQVLERGAVSAEGDAGFRRAAYAGDWRTLTLTRDERALFQDGEADEERAVVRDLAPDLAGRLGRDVYDALLRRID